MVSPLPAVLPYTLTKDLFQIHRQNPLRLPLQTKHISDTLGNTVRRRVRVGIVYCLCVLPKEAQQVLHVCKVPNVSL